jgi:hypothetical protein
MLERFAGEGLPCGPKHSHDTLAGYVRTFLKVLKSHSRVDIVAQHSLACRKIAVDDTLDGLAKKRLTEIRIALHPRPDGFLKLKSWVRGIILLNLLFLSSFVRCPA